MRPPLKIEDMNKYLKKTMSEGGNQDSENENLKKKKKEQHLQL